MSDVVVGTAVINLDAETAGVSSQMHAAGAQAGNAYESGFERGAAGMTATAEQLHTGISKSAAKHAGIAQRVWKIAFGNIVARMTQGLVYGASAMVKFGLQTIGTLDGAKRGFTALTGSVEEANKFMDQLKKTAIATPFELPNLAETTRKILAVSGAIGLTGKTMDETRNNVFGLVNTLGDLVATFGGTQQQFDNAVLAVSQMGSQGHIAAQEMRQLNDALPGFNAWDQLAKGMGISEEQLRKMVKSGQVLSKDALPILLQRMKEFPGAAGAMANAAKTITGVFSNLKDLVGLALADALLPFSQALIEAFSPSTGTLINQLQDAFKAFGTLIGDTFVALVPLMGDFLTTLAVVATAADRLVKRLIPIVTPLLRIVMALTRSAIKRLSQFGDAVAQWWKDIKPTRDALGDFLDRVLKPFTDWAANNQAAVQTMAVALASFAGSLLLIGQAVKTATSITTFVGGIVALLPLEGAALVVALVAAAIVAVGVALFFAYKKIKPFRDAVDKAAKFFKEVWDGIWKWFEDNWGGIWKTVTDIWNNIVGVVTTGVNGIKTAISGIRTAWDATWAGVSAVVEAVVSFTQGLWKQYGDEFTGIFNGIRDIIVGVWNDIWSIVEPIVTWFRDQIPGAWQFIQNVAGVIWPYIAGIIQQALTAVQTAFQIFVDIVGPLWDHVWAVATIVVQGTYEAIRTIVEGILKFIRGVIDIIAGIVTGDWGRIWDGFKSILAGAWTIAKGVLQEVITFFKVQWQTIKDFITKPFETAFNIVKDIINGFKDTFNNVITTVKGMWNGFARAFNGLTFPTIGPWDISVGVGPISKTFTVGPYGGWDLPNLPILDMGAVITKPTVSILAANSRPEVIIPLSNPNRAAQLIQQSGLGAQLGGPTSVLTINQATFVTPTDVDLLFQKAEAALVLTGAI